MLNLQGIVVPLVLHEYGKTPIQMYFPFIFVSLKLKTFPVVQMHLHTGSLVSEINMSPRGPNCEVH